jgi:DNA-binding NtrC family response regulator
MTDHPGFNPPITECDIMRRARGTAQRLSRTDIPVLLKGESGTGRTTLAQAVVSVRATSRVSVTVLGLDGFKVTIREDAVVLVLGLDDLPADDQRRLAGMVARGTSVVGTALPTAVFDPVLAVILDAGTITLPPLRDREDDAVMWCDLQLQVAAKKMGRTPFRLNGEARNATKLHRWPGNLHEVKQRAERAVAMTDDRVITPEHLGIEEEAIAPSVVALEEAVVEFRKRYIREVLDRCSGNRTQAARVLKVDPRTRFRFLQAEGEPKK